MKNTLTFVAAIALTTSAIAGGDDRDLGPVEALDSVVVPVVVPVAGKIAITDQALDAMKLGNIPKVETPKVSDTDKVIGQTPSGFAVTQSAHEACQATLSLSDDNIVRFKNALAGGVLFNTGPVHEKGGTSFSPSRWADYFSCVKGQ